MRETAATVFTLQGGVDDRAARATGDGPFRTYAVPPAEMISLVGAVMKTKVVAVFEDAHRGEVCAKERESKLATEDTYAEAWRSAVVVFVHPVPGERRRRPNSRSTRRSAAPFHMGDIDWEAELPPLFDDAVAHRGTTPIRPLR